MPSGRHEVAESQEEYLSNRTCSVRSSPEDFPLRRLYVLTEGESNVVVCLWVALATTVSRSRERLKKLPWVPLVGRPTRWSLLFIFGFLFWSSSWCLQPNIGVSFSVWPLPRAGMVVLDQFFSKMYFLYIWRSQNKNFTKFWEVLPPQKKVYFRTLGVSQKLWLNRPHFGIKYR